MITTITQSQFRDSFYNAGREKQFSYNGLTALYNYLVEYEEDTDSQIELDVIALCCEYSEYEDIKEFQNDYNAEEYETIKDIEEQTTVIKIDDESFIIQYF